MKTQNHQSSLDGLRGVAIFLVLLFHLFERHQTLIPWLSDYAGLWPMKYGFLGVELFFMLSGFLIAQSLDESNGVAHFLFKRWWRLFPIMAAASALIFLTAGLLAERPQGIPTFVDILPGLLFIHPYFFEKLLGTQLQPLEWSFWSLFVEIIFYITYAILYFLAKKKATGGLLLIFIFSFFLKLFSSYLGINSSIVIKLVDSCFIYFGWFCIGTLIYRNVLVNSLKSKLLTFFVLCLSTYATTGVDFLGALMCLTLYLIFYFGVSSKFLKKILSIKILTWLGFISYPLYLIHENALIALTIKVKKIVPEGFELLTPLPGLFLLLVVAYLLARYMDLRKYWTWHQSKRLTDLAN